MTTQKKTIDILSKKARACTLCANKLPLGPKPIIQTHHLSKILIVSQAPGSIAHHSGIPFMDKSGERLRAWMGISEHVFYDPKNIAIVPMGFCYPGKAKSGDVPPPIECAEKWQNRFDKCLTSIQLRLLIGQYSQKWHLGANCKNTLTKTVRCWREFANTSNASHGTSDKLVEDFPLPHPSPRNNIWLAKNPWFAEDVLPALRQRVARILKE